MFNLNNLKSVKKKKSRRVGRGNASGRGTTAGRGTKGQRARSGGRKGLKLFGLKQTFHKIPKSQGFVSFYAKLKAINLEDLEKKYKDGETVKLAKFKILAKGQINKKLTVFASAFSKKAEEAIIKAGGKAIKCGKK
jgi:large subunit ribosomal protein L15